MFSTPAASFFPVGGIDRNNTSIDFSGLQPQPRTSTTPSHASDGNFNDLSETLASCHASPIAQSESRTPSAGRAPAVSGSHPPRQQLDSKRPHHNHHSTMCVCHRCTFVKIAQLTAALANLNRHAQHLAFTKHNRISTSTRCFGSPMSLTLLHHISRPRVSSIFGLGLGRLDVTNSLAGNVQILMGSQSQNYSHTRQSDITCAACLQTKMMCRTPRMMSLKQPRVSFKCGLGLGRLDVTNSLAGIGNVQVLMGSQSQKPSPGWFTSNL